MEISQKIVLVLVPIGLGLFFRWVRLFSDEEWALLRKFVVRFTVPIFVFFSLYEARAESISAILPMMVAFVLMTAVLFAIGATAVAGSAFVYFTAHDIGVPNDTGELVGAVGSGAGLVCFVLPGALLRGRPSKAERGYMDYMRTKYNVIPVVELDRHQGVMVRLNLLALRF